MLRNLRIPVFDFVSSLSRVMDLMDTAIVDHHLRTAYIALKIAQQAGFPPEAQREIVLAGALHDIGAFHFGERLRLLEFETDVTNQHAEAGYHLLRIFEPFRPIADIVRFHHVPWNNGQGAMSRGEPVPMECHVLHLSDRIAAAIRSDEPVLRQAAGIRQQVEARSGQQFVPELVKAFCELASMEYFWLEATSTALESILRRSILPTWLEVDMTSLTQFAYLLCRIIDFKSEFTATHSSGIAACAVALARYAGFSEQEQQTMRIAAYLHDLGKLAVPAEILEKPGALTDEEHEVMLGHVYYTYDILDRIDGLETITEWSSLHQERMDGQGYPFRRNGSQLPLGARILAVADVFTALTETRPYRDPIPKEEAVEVLRRLAGDSKLDGRVVDILAEHLNEIDSARALAQQAALKDYREFAEAVAVTGARGRTC